MSEIDVYKLISKVSEELSHEGISKDRTSTNASGKVMYNFRGIDDIYNTLAPIIAKHGLVILPRVISRECTERTSSNNNALFYVVVEAEFDFISSNDGSKHTVKTFGEAMDSGDKATNKAMSAAYKYAAFQAFCIPTQADNDADATTQDNIRPKQKTSVTLPPYSDEKFDANKETWKISINKGKHTPDDIINMISTKHKLTEEQIKNIKKLGEKDDANT